MRRYCAFGLAVFLPLGLSCSAVEDRSGVGDGPLGDAAAADWGAPPADLPGHDLDRGAADRATDDGQGKTDPNVAGTGTGVRWYSLAGFSADSPSAKHKALNDGDLSTYANINTQPETAAGAVEAAGVRWSGGTVRVSRVVLVNGDISAGGNGYLEAGITLQGSLDGATWSAAPFSKWSMSPAYPYDKTAAGRTYRWSGPPVSGLKGMRVTGRVNVKGGSRYWRVKEVQVFGKVSGLPKLDQGVSSPDAIMPDSGPPMGPAFAPLSPGTLTYFTFQDNTPCNSAARGTWWRNDLDFIPFVSVSTAFRLIDSAELAKIPGLKGKGAKSGGLKFGEKLYVSWLDGRVMPNGKKHNGIVRLDTYCGDGGDDSYCYQSTSWKNPNSGKAGKTALLDLYLGDWIKSGHGKGATCGGPGGSGAEKVQVYRAPKGVIPKGAAPYGSARLGSGTCGDCKAAKAQQKTSTGKSCYDYDPSAYSYLCNSLGKYKGIWIN